MPTFANDINGNTPLFYIPITLSSNAGLGFQQQIEHGILLLSKYCIFISLGSLLHKHRQFLLSSHLLHIIIPLELLI